MNPSPEENPSKEHQHTPQESKSGGTGEADYTKLQTDDVARVADKPSSEEAPKSTTGATTAPSESNPYIQAGALPPPTTKNKDKGKDKKDKKDKKKDKKDKEKDDLGKWGKLAEDLWQHFKTGPSVIDVALTRIAHGSKVLAEGGYDKVFRNAFEILPEEKLLTHFACYLSTSYGPVGGVLYLSTTKVAFCSDSPLSQKVNDEIRLSYYKIAIGLNQLKTVKPTESKTNPAEKYIQIISVDNHEFWFLGFVTYDSAVKSMLHAARIH